MRVATINKVLFSGVSVVALTVGAPAMAQAPDDAEDDAIEELGMDLVEDYHHVQLERQPLSLA